MKLPNPQEQVAQPAIQESLATPATQKGVAIPPVQERVVAGGTPRDSGRRENPFVGNVEAAEQGEKLFSVFNCDGCHGGGAVGFVGPSLADGRWRYGGSAAVIFETIYAGRPNGMPSFGAVLPEEGIWKIVTYLQSLQPAADQPTISF